MAHVSAAHGRKKKATGRGGGQTPKHHRIEPYSWLGAGILTVGFGVAALGGAGAAMAEDGTTDSSPSTAGSDSASTAGPRSGTGVEGKPSQSAAEQPGHGDDAAETADDEPPATTGARRVARGHTSVDPGPDAHDSEIVDLPATAEPRERVPMRRHADPDLAPGVLLLAAASQPTNRTFADETVLVPSPLAAVDPNTPPTATLTRQSSPTSSTGAVTGTVKASDVDGDKLTYTGMTTAKGVVKVTTRGSFTYTPTKAARHAAAAVGATGVDKSDTVVITVSDGRGGLAEVPVTVPIGPSNRTPTAVKSAVAKPHPITGVVTGSVTARDADGDALTYTVSSPKDGSVTLDADGTFTYTSSDAARARARSTRTVDTDTFTVTVDDGHGGVRSTTVRVTIAPVDRAPVAGTPTFGTPASSTGTVKGSVNAQDPDGDTISYRGSVKTIKGRFTVSSSGKFTYTPNAAARHAAATGATSAMTDTVTVVATDKYGAVTSVVVTVPILAKNVAPNGVTTTVGRPDPVTGVVTGTVKAKDPDGDPVTFGGPTTTGRGNVIVDPNGGFTYTPTVLARAAAASNQATPADRKDSFTVVVNDGHGGFAFATVEVAIAPATAGAGGSLSPNDLLGLATAKAVEVVQNADGTVGVIRGNFSLDAVRDTQDAAKVLDQIAELLGAPAGFARDAVITAVRSEQQTEDGTFSETFYRLVQTLDGIPVLGGEIVLVTDDKGVVTAVFNRYDHRVDTMDRTHTVGGDAAKATARDDLLDALAEYLTDDAARNAFLASLDYRVALVIDGSNPATSPRLLWQVDVFTPEPAIDDVIDPAGSTPSISARYLVGANGAAAGTIVAASWDSDALHAFSPASDSARDKLNQTRNINIQQSGQTAVLIDSVRNIRIFSSEVKPSKTDPGSWDFTKFPGSLVQKGFGWDPTVGFFEWDPSAVSAEANVAYVFDYYKNTLGKKTYSFADRYGVGNGVKVILVGDNYPTATYLFNNAAFVFARDTEAAMDVVAHEFTHAVIGDIVGRDSTAGLIGNVESRALNESFADILGSLIEFQFDGGANRWVIGEDAGCGGNGRITCRSLATPKTYADIRDQDDPYDVMGVFNYAAYRMMNEYSATSGISAKKWTRVFYNSLQRLSFGAKFTDAAHAIISSAKAQNFTPAQIAAVEDAFRQAEILTPTGYVPPAPVENPSAPAVGVAVPGYPAVGTRFNRDGTRVMVATYAHIGTEAVTRVVLVDAKSGLQVGKAFTVDGGINAEFNAAGTRLVVAAVDETSVGGYTSVVTVLSTATANPVGAALSLPGSVNEVRFAEAGNIAVLSVADGHAGGNQTAVTRAVMVDLSNGRQLGSAVEVPGYGSAVTVVGTSDKAMLGAAHYEVDGSITYRMVLVNTRTGAKSGSFELPGPSTGVFASRSGTRMTVLSSVASTTVVSVFDVDTGAQVGTRKVIDGDLSGSSWAATFIQPNTDRLVVTTSEYGGSADPRLRVALFDLVSGAQIGGVLDLGRGASAQAFGNTAGTRAFVVVSTQDPGTRTFTSRLISVDTATGTRIAESASLAGSVPYHAQLSGDESRVLVPLEEGGPSGRSRLVVLDGTTGAAVGSGLTLAGYYQGFVTDGRRALAYGAGTRGDWHVGVLDVSTGSQIGTEAVISGPVTDATFSRDGTRAALTIYQAGFDGAPQLTKVLVFDTSSGRQIGDTVVVAGRPADGGAQFSPDGSRILLSASSRTPSDGLTGIAVIDAATGAQVGTTVTLAGNLSALDLKEDDAVLLTPDSSRALVATDTAQFTGGSASFATGVTVIDLRTGAPVGQTATFDGRIRDPLAINDRGDRAVLTVYTDTGSPHTQLVVFNASTGEVLGGVR